MLESLLQWDRDTFVFLNNLGSNQWDSFWRAITSLTTWIPLFLFLIVLIIWIQGRKNGLRQLGAVLIMVSFILLLTKVVKMGVARLRPNNDETVNTLIRILKSPTDFSFFSGHAATSFGIALLTYLFLRKKAPWIGLLFIWAILFTMSRIFVGVHYPIDIIMGALVGILSATLFYRLYGKFIKPCST